MREEGIKMLIKEVLNEFAKFAEYDPNQKSFQLNSAKFEFHQAGKDIEQLLSGFDIVCYARQRFPYNSGNQHQGSALQLAN